MYTKKGVGETMPGIQEWHRSLHLQKMYFDEIRGVHVTRSVERNLITISVQH